MLFLKRKINILKVIFIPNYHTYSMQFQSALQWELFWTLQIDPKDFSGSVKIYNSQEKFRIHKAFSFYII